MGLLLSRLSLALSDVHWILLNFVFNAKAKSYFAFSTFEKDDAVIMSLLDAGYSRVNFVTFFSFLFSFKAFGYDKKKNEKNLFTILFIIYRFL